jgi:hypothetical protein
MRPAIRTFRTLLQTLRPLTLLPAIVLVISQTAGSSSGMAITSVAVDTTGANFLLVQMSYLTSVGATLADSKSNSWAGLTAQGMGASSSGVFAYVASPTVGTGHTFTASCIGGSSCYPSVIVWAFSGVMATSPLDGQNGLNANNSTTAVQAATAITTTSAGDLCVSGITSGTAGLSVTNDVVGGGSGDTGMNANQIYQTNSGLNFGEGSAYVIEGAAGSVNPQWTPNGGQQLQGVMTACFKPAAGAGGPTFVALTVAP